MFKNCAEDDCPAGTMTWFDAVDYANRASERVGLPACYVLSDCQREGGAITDCAAVTLTASTVYLCLGYRLPTDVEWEVAARAGTLTAFYSGDAQNLSGDWYAQDPALDPIAWYLFNTRPEPPPAVVTMSTHPVGQKLPNGYGLYDILGNATEYASTPFDNVPRQPEVDAGGGVEPLEWNRGNHGGGAFMSSDSCWAAAGFSGQKQWEVCERRRPPRADAVLSCLVIANPDSLLSVPDCPSASLPCREKRTPTMWKQTFVMNAVLLLSLGGCGDRRERCEPRRGGERRNVAPQARAQEGRAE